MLGFDVIDSFLKPLERVEVIGADTDRFEPVFVDGGHDFFHIGIKSLAACDDQGDGYVIFLSEAFLTFRYLSWIVSSWVSNTSLLPGWEVGLK